MYDVYLHIKNKRALAKRKEDYQFHTKVTKYFSFHKDDDFPMLSEKNNGQSKIRQCTPSFCFYI